MTSTLVPGLYGQGRPQLASLSAGGTVFMPAAAAAGTGAGGVVGR